MHVLLTPNLPASVRALAERQLPAGCTLEIMAASHPDYAGRGRARAECLMGLPRARFDAAFFARARRSCGLVQLLRAGHELVDLPAAAARPASRSPRSADATASIVAEHCLMLMLALVRKLRWQHEAVVHDRWLVAKPWQLPNGDVDSVPEMVFQGLEGRTLAILGLGAIGSRVAAARARIRDDRARPGRDSGSENGAGAMCPCSRCPSFLAGSDVVSLHLRLSPETKQIIDERALSHVRPGAFLINTARGELVDETALLGALNRGQLAGAALDTLAKEPPPTDHPLLRRDDVLLTPHTAWLTRESWQRTFDVGFANVQRFLNGEALRNLVV